MKILNLTGTKRSSIGRTNANALRRDGKVPCILYGGTEIVHFEATEKEFKSLVYTPDVHLVKLDVGGKQTDAILQAVQYHPITDKILHIDFLEVMGDKPVVMDIPVRTTGTSAGVKEGGMLLKKLNRIRVKGPISKIPDIIELNIEAMKIGDYIRIKDLQYDGVTYLHESSVTIVAVKATRVVVEEVAPVAAAAAAPAAGAAAAAEGAPAAEAKTEEKKK